jgi:hypothetical protein
VTAPIDTSTLGPVRFDPDAEGERVRRARAILDRVLPNIAGITATQARARAIAAMLEFETAERAARP